VGRTGSLWVPDTPLGKHIECILKCLGAAVIMQWIDFPTDIGRNIFANTILPVSFNSSGRFPLPATLRTA
jgi:hypothetical protein